MIMSLKKQLMLAIVHICAQRVQGNLAELWFHLNTVTTKIRMKIDKSKDKNTHWNKDEKLWPQYQLK